MTHLFSANGDQAIREIVARTPLLALDFDGTLAPIVTVPDRARVPVAISRMLGQIGEFLPIAIITGRAVADVTERLGFVPDYIVGNHGAEGLPDSEVDATTHIVEQWRHTLDNGCGARLDAAGVTIENKGYSLSLHYRLALDRALALAAIQTAVAGLLPPPRVIDGKCVTNLLPLDAPDKFHAVSALARIANCDTVIFAGDDVTDDVVFERAQVDWLTIRIEALEHHRARFHLNHQSEFAMFLQRLLRSLERHRKTSAGPHDRGIIT